MTRTARPPALVTNLTRLVGVDLDLDHIRGSIRPATCTIEVAGRISPKASACARPTSSHREMSVTKMRVRTTSSSEESSCSRAQATFLNACAVCS